MGKIIGNVTTIVGGKKIEIKYGKGESQYTNKYIRRGLTEKELDDELQMIVSEKDKLFSSKRLEVEDARKFVKSYENYILERYGENSKQYNFYKNITFEIGTVFTTPNIYMLAWRNTMKNGIEIAVDYAVKEREN